jgi:hypothetical protein
VPLTHKVSRSTWYVLVVIYLSMFAAVAATMIYSKHVADSDTRKFCAVVITLDNTYKRTPPQTAAGKQVAVDMANLRQSLGCNEKGNHP